MRYIYLLIRCSTLRFAAPFAVVVTLLHSWSSQWWVGSMQDTVQVTTNGATVASALLVAAAAVDMRRAAKPDSATPLRQASRSRWTIVAALTGAALFWSFASYGLSLATNAAATLARTETVSLPADMLLLGVLSLTAHTILGLALGRFLPLIAAIPLGLFMSYAYNVALAYEPTRPTANLTALYDGLVTTGYGLRTTFVLAQGLWFASIAVGLVACLVLSFSPHRRSRLIGGAVLATAVVAAAGAANGLTQENAPRARLLEAEDSRTCTDTATNSSVCVWDEHAYMLATIADITQGMTEPSTGWKGTPVQVIESGLAPTQRDEVQVFLGGNSASPFDLARTLAAGVAAHEFCIQDPIQVDNALLDRELWLVARGLSDPTVLDGLDDTEVPAVLGLGPDEQWAWAKKIQC